MCSSDKALRKYWACSSVGMNCSLRSVSGRSIIRAGFFEMISLRLASLRTAETTVRYFCTVASWMGLPGGFSFATL